jgi:Holliday junction resolvase RusA-like endonuclease
VAKKCQEQLMERMSAKEFRNRYTGGSSLHKNNLSASEVEAYDQAIQALCDIQSHVPNLLFRGDVGIEVIVQGRSNADRDNIFKGVADSLQGLVFEDDKQVKEGSFKSQSIRTRTIEE